MSRSALGLAWSAAAAFLRRHAKSKAVREAEKRREERRRRDAARRAKQSCAVAGASAGGTFLYAITVAPLASAGFAASAAGMGALALVYLWRTRRAAPPGFSRQELVALPVQAEEWLLEQRALLPSHADPALDTLLTHLGELPPHLARLDPNRTLAWEARRLIGEHLPGLVGSWCALPTAAREADLGARHRLVHGLGTIAEELGRVLMEASRDERMALETRGRFLDGRYREGPLSVR